MTAAGRGGKKRIPPSPSTHTAGRQGLGASAGVRLWVRLAAGGRQARPAGVPARASAPPRPNLPPAYPPRPASPPVHRTKLAGEAAVAARWPNHAILRSSLIYGPDPPLVPVSRPLFLQFVDASLAAKVGGGWVGSGAVAAGARVGGRVWRRAAAHQGPRSGRAPDPALTLAALSRPTTHTHTRLRACSAPPPFSRMSGDAPSACVTLCAWCRR